LLDVIKSKSKDSANKLLASETQMKNIVTLGVMAVGFVFVSGSAIAGVPPVHIPEPMSMSLLAGGIVVIAAVKRMRRN